MLDLSQSLLIGSFRLGREQNMNDRITDLKMTRSYHLQTLLLSPGSFGSFIISWLDWVVGIGIEILCLSLESVTYNPRISLHWSVVLSSYNWLTCIPKTVITQNDLFNSIKTRVGHERSDREKLSIDINHMIKVLRIEEFILNDKNPIFLLFIYHKNNMHSLVHLSHGYFSSYINTFVHIVHYFTM